MVITVLDASSLLRFLLGEAGAQRVKEILTESQRGSGRALISAVNWGEVVGKIYKLQGKRDAEALTANLEFQSQRSARRPPLS